MGTSNALLKNIDVSNKNTFNVMLSVFNDYKSIDSICNETNISKLKVQQIINFLDENEVITTQTDIDSNNMIKEMYKLKENLDFIDDGKLSNAIEMIKLFSDAMKELMNNIYSEKFGTAYNIIIKCNEDTVNDFLKEYKELIDKFESIEDTDSKESYAFISGIARFKSI